MVYQPKKNQYYGSINTLSILLTILIWLESRPLLRVGLKAAKGTKGTKLDKMAIGVENTKSHLHGG